MRMVENLDKVLNIYLSDTQRIRISNSVVGITISKQWRKSKLEEFRTSKGITVPHDSVPEVVSFLTDKE